MKIDQEDGVIIGLHVRCMTLHVQTVDPQHKFRSNQMETDLFIVRNVSRNINPRDFNRNIFDRIPDFLFFVILNKKKRYHFIILLKILMVVYNLIKVPSSNTILTYSKKFFRVKFG